VESGADDAMLQAVIAEAHTVGIDVPFGWPDAFVNAIAEYGRNGFWPPTVTTDSKEAPRRLQYRETDRFVWKETGRPPLSVSSDRIAVPAMRAAALFTKLAKKGEAVARDGSGKVIEVYPAAAIRRWWGVPYAQRYKGKKNRDGRCALLDKIQNETNGWLQLGNGISDQCQDSDDALDALVAGLVGRAAAIGQCEQIPDNHREKARREGWIALPKQGTLGTLAS
jgi:hypothetical protein